MKREEALAALKVLYAAGVTVSPRVNELSGPHLIAGLDFSLKILDPHQNAVIWVYDGPHWSAAEQYELWYFRGYRLRRILTMRNNGRSYKWEDQILIREISFNGKGEPSIRTNFKEKQNGK